MQKYVSFSIVNKTKFYLKTNGNWETDYKNLYIYYEDEVGEYFNKRKRRYEKKSKNTLINVEEYIPC